MSANKKNVGSVTHDFNVVLSGQKFDLKHSDSIILDKDIGLDFRGLQAALPSVLSAEDEDLLLIAVAIAHIDRKVPRRLGKWCRNLALNVPVKSPDIWSNKTVYYALNSCLNMLTGDSWNLRFYPDRKAIFSTAIQSNIFPIDADAIIPYSGGLDSKATHAIYSAKSAGKPPLAITTLHASRSKSQALNYDRELSKLWLGVNIHVGHGSHQESSYRTRSFLFLVICAIIAKALGIPKILVPETGQGAIGSALIRWGYDYPQYGSHPIFTYQLKVFLQQLWGAKAPNFEHPNLWLTKGELLQEFVGTFDKPIEAEQAILKRCSCSQGHIFRFRFKNPGDYYHHCGICPNCLFRRVALVNAALDDFHEKEFYIWKKLSASSFDDMRFVEELDSINKSRSYDHDQFVAKSSFILHRDFARLAEKPLTENMIRMQAKELAEGIGREEDFCLFSLGRLIRRHAEQWSAFNTKQIGQTSWFQDFA